MAETIYALSSGRPPAGVAVVRLSGPGTRAAVEADLVVGARGSAHAFGPFRDIRSMSQGWRRVLGRGIDGRR